VLVSFGDAFQHKYPFYDLHVAEGLWPYLWGWWALYALQFVALEFFFRGFLVHGLAPRFGYAAVFVMIVPYNMIHFQKPMLEALAAIVGGAVLGTLSLKTRSIWWGAALHISIAGTMDVLALWHRGTLF
jgi:membrane protease YdiL (CAAX protease family)